MEQNAFAGPLIRMLRLEKNWSQETLCRGICAVSYLSKIEQGRVLPNDGILVDLFSKLDLCWQSDASKRADAEKICEDTYEAVFSADRNSIMHCSEILQGRWSELAMGPWYLDFLILRACCTWDPSMIPHSMESLFDARQRCLLYILRKEPVKALQQYPCALTALAAGAQAYTDGNYALALENLQMAYDMACQKGYVYLMMNCQLFIANCYSDLRNLESMMEHNQIAGRLARALGDHATEHVIGYNIASTKIECGDFEAGYRFFSVLEERSVLDQHKLAICCEKLGKTQEALNVLDQAEASAEGIDSQMCRLVRYRLEHPDYLHEEVYGKLLMDTFNGLRRERSVGYARFHLPWVEEWCTANRQYRLAFEIMRDFT